MSYRLFLAVQWIDDHLAFCRFGAVCNLVERLYDRCSDDEVTDADLAAQDGKRALPTGGEGDDRSE